MTTRHKCAGKTWSDIGHQRVYRCSRNATIERDGKWYCWQHDPIRVEADKQKRRARWDARHDREAAKWERRTRNAKLAALASEETAALLERLARDVSDRCKSDIPCVTARYERNAKGGYELAAQIREVLGD